MLVVNDDHHRRLAQRLWGFDDVITDGRRLWTAAVRVTNVRMIRSGTS